MAVMTQVFNVSGMSCQHCVKTITQALSQKLGVASSEIELNNGKVTVTFDDQFINAEQIKSIIEDLGFDAVY